MDAYTTFAAMARDAVDAYITARMIELSDRILVMQKISDPYPLEQKMSKTVRVPQVARLSLPTTQLTEGVTPSTNALVLTDVEVTVEQWGIVALLTDVVQLTVKHPLLNIAIERVGMAMKETSEREDANVLMGATNVTYAGGKSSRSTLAATDVLNTPLVIQMVAKLKMRGAPKYLPDGLYMGIMQPPHTADVLGADQTFQQASFFSKERRLEYGYLGPWMGVDWVEGNFLPVHVGVAAPTTGAATATKAKYTVGTNGTMSSADYGLKIVAREVTTDYERRISVLSGAIAVTSPGSIAVVLPSSTNYVYDIYMTEADDATGTQYLVASRQAASSTYTITTEVTGDEDTAPDAPASGVSVYPGFVLGRGGYGTVTLNGMALQTFVTPSGASDSDPLNQRKKIGAKYMRKSFILENNFIERFETSSGIDAVIPA